MAKEVGKILDTVIFSERVMVLLQDGCPMRFRTVFYLCSSRVGSHHIDQYQPHDKSPDTNIFRLDVRVPDIPISSVGMINVLLFVLLQLVPEFFLERLFPQLD